MNFSQKLKALRKQRKISQGQLGEMVGISRRMISQYENGEISPRMSALKKLADVLEVSMDYLLDDSITELPDDPSSETEEYVHAARERYGDTGAMEISRLLEANRALFAGGELSEEAKDDFFKAITEAYFVGKEEAKRRKMESGSQSGD